MQEMESFNNDHCQEQPMQFDLDGPSLLIDPVLARAYITLPRSNVVDFLHKFRPIPPPSTNTPRSSVIRPSTPLSRPWVRVFLA